MKRHWFFFQMIAALPAVIPETGLSWIEVGTVNISEFICAIQLLLQKKSRQSHRQSWSNAANWYITNKIDDGKYGVYFPKLVVTICIRIVLTVSLVISHAYHFHFSLISHCHSQTRDNQSNVILFHFLLVAQSDGPKFEKEITWEVMTIAPSSDAGNQSFQLR